MPGISSILFIPMRLAILFLKKERSRNCPAFCANSNKASLNGRIMAKDASLVASAPEESRVHLGLQISLCMKVNAPACWVRLSRQKLA
jgi:hypothetical protein